MKAIFILMTMLLATHLYGQAKIVPFRIGIIVSNVNRASTWYENNLEFRTYKRMEFPEYDSLKINFFRLGDFELELVEKKTSLSIKKLRPGYNENREPLEGFSKIAFQIDDIRTVFEKLQRNGVNVIYGITYDKAFKETFFIVEDVDGNALQFIQKKEN